MIRKQKQTMGVTLIEAVVVIAVIAIVSATLFAVVAPRMKKKSVETQCIANLKNVVAAINVYMGDWDLPPPKLSVILPKEIISCPIESISYHYEWQFFAQSQNGRTMWETKFEPSKHAIVKCIQHYNNDCEYSLSPMTNIYGKSIMRKVPSLKKGENLVVLSGFMGGTVKYANFNDASEMDLGIPSPGPR